jgi:predicted MFS family arabinose efflux permease
MHDLREVARMATLPAMRGVMVLVFASFASVLGLRGLWGGPWLMEAKGLTRIEAGNVLLVCTLALIAGPALAGWTFRRVGRPVALLACSHLIAAALIAALVAGASLPASFDTALLAAFSIVISFQIVAFSMVRAAVPAEQAGRALSAANLSFFLGAAVLQGLSGIMASAGGLVAALLTFAAALVLCTAGFLLLRPRG